MPAVKILPKHLITGIFIFFPLSFFSLHTAAQNTYVPLNGYSYHLIDRIDIQSDSVSLHTAVKPYLRTEVAAMYREEPIFLEGPEFNQQKADFNANYLLTDNSEYDTSFVNGEGKFLKYFYREPDAFYSVHTKNFFLKVNPVIQLIPGFSSDTSELKFINTRGVELRGGIDNKVGFYFYATDNQAKLPGYINERVGSSNHVLPGEGRVKLFKGTGVDYLDAHGYVAFNATRHIAVQFGQDKIFIGDGLRSMIWSDNSDDFLFLKLNTHVWKLNYQNIFAELANYNDGYIYDSLIEKKYAAMHHLSVNLTDKINIGLFESVIFARTDSSGNNSGFDLHYLNPIIFYRAVESGLGSPDNVLLGANWKWNFLHSFSFYGQFVLDELVVGQFIKASGWWGNKNALQLGLKYIDAFHIPSLDLQYEFNMARPYTYSYTTNSNSYTHYAQALAHPLGANFKENIAKLWYQLTPNITLENTFIRAAYGSDTAASNWGGNIFLNYNTYEQPYDNYTGQGVENILLFNDVSLSWQCWHNIFLEANCIYRKNTSEIPGASSKEIFAGIGIRMNIAERKNYF